MHYTGPVYRPPLEAYTPLLEVTYGCSWRKCSFCTMYHEQKFGISPIEDIESDLKEMSEQYPKNLKRIFLVNGDAFVLPARKLLEISELIHKYFPEIECISCYASVRNIKSKSDEDLRKLKEAKFDSLYIGLETAYDPALEQMKKGYTAKDEYIQLKRLEDVDMEYNSLIMLGVAGRGNCKAHIEETLKLVNRFKPKRILVTSTSLQENTPLSDMRDAGEFVEATEREILEEELMLLENLEMDDDCLFFGSHPHNLIGFTQYLKYKDDMVKKLKEAIRKIDVEKPGLLDGVLSRGHL